MGAAPSGRLTGWGQEVPGPWPAGQDGVQRNTLATPAVYVAFTNVTRLTAETQATQDPGTRLLLDDK